MPGAGTDDGGSSGTGLGETDGGDDGGSSETGDTADAGDTASEPGATTEGGPGTEAGGGAGSAADAAGGGDGQAAAGGSLGGAQVGGAHRRDTTQIDPHEREEYLGLEAGALSAQINSALFEGGLLEDASQPEEFRGAWNTILSAYAESSAELATYLQSAFRAVTESALMYQEADQAVEAFQAELRADVAAGREVAADGWLAEIRAARDGVKVASARLEAAILAAAQAGRGAEVDQVLEDVIVAALQGLMDANERLFVETEVLAAVTASLRDSRAAGEAEIDPDEMASTRAQAREDAHAVVAEMRARWDRIAQDVLAAFLNRLNTGQGGADVPGEVGPFDPVRG
jgi:hypothetical protein